MDDLVISQSLVSDNDGAGVRFPTSLSSLGTVDISDTTIQDNLGMGLISYSPGTISITDSTFSGNATNLATGGELVLTSFDSGNLTLDNVSFISDNADCAIRISPSHDGGHPPLRNRWSDHLDDGRDHQRHPAQERVVRVSRDLFESDEGSRAC
jgi:hypothetical protein